MTPTGVRGIIEAHLQAEEESPLLQKDIAARIAKAERYLKTAKLALDEGDYDSCVSRAYYAVFHACIALLVCYVDKGAADWKHLTIINNSISAFAKRRKWFVHLKDTSGSKSFAESLHNLRLAREDADYGVDVITKSRSQSALRFAGRFLQEAKRRLK